MGLLVFTQTVDGRIDPAALVRAASRYFDAELDITGLADDPRTLVAPALCRVQLVLRDPRHAGEQAFSISSRERHADDLEAARRAEARGRSSGMSQLAERCRYVWEPRAEMPSACSEAATLKLCAILASVALGPVLPPDESALFGVRGAM